MDLNPSAADHQFDRALSPNITVTVPHVYVSENCGTLGQGVSLF